MSAALAALVLVLASTPAMAQNCVDDWRARIVSPQGPVEIRRAGTTVWITAGPGDSLCTGDSIQVLDFGRVLITLPDETETWLDQGTTITFVPPQDEKRTWIDILIGVIYFISRDPTDVHILTPFADAGIEGTEFAVAVTETGTTVSVFEGTVRVSNTIGQVLVNSQQQASARAGQAPQLAPLTISPADAVQWALYYDPILASPLIAADATPAPQQVDDVSFYVGRAASRLGVGRVDEAGADLGQALQRDSGNAEAVALQSVIAVALNRADDALALATRAVTLDSGSAAALIALSYAQQANLDIEGARDSVEAAVAGERQNPAAWARLSEMRLAIGDVEGAREAAEEARRLNPNLVRSQTVLGFADLAVLELGDALETFRRAIEIDHSAPLPHLGLGLALIRSGDLAAGRGELQIAVGLDRSNSLIRSYVGRAYFAERRPDLAATELDMAKSLDPRDPTPFYYDALLKQSLNRPADALRDLDQSIERNDNRAVYRSRLLLDDDLASRSASVGRIYGDLGFTQLALLQGWQSLESDPANYSAQRLFADTYASLPRHEIARVNSLFQSQLLQPLNITPVPPQLAEANLFILDSAGPAEIGFNEFNPVFNRNRTLAFQGSGVAGSNGTRGENVTVSGIADRWSYSVGQFHFETDGFRENNDLDQDVWNAFVQFQPSYKTSLLMELRSTEREQGDLELLFDPQEYIPSLRDTEESESIRIGVRHSLSPRSDIIASLVREDIDQATTIGTEFSGHTTIEGYTGELQHIYRGRRLRLTSGLRYADRDDDDLVEISAMVPFPPFLIEIVEEARFAVQSASLYSYANIDLTERMSLTLGASVDDIDGRQFKRDQIDPKIGLAWRARSGTVIRAASSRTVLPSALSRQDILPRLEPTQVVGFAQFIAGSESEESRQYALALDHPFSDRLHGGLRIQARDLVVPYKEETGPPTFDLVDRMADVTENLAGIFAYWTPGSRLSLRVEYQEEKLRNDPLFTPLGFISLDTRRAPIEFNYHGPGGFSAGITSTYIEQDGVFPNPLPPFTPTTAGDEFWVLDTAMSYRFANRRGIVSLSVKNLFDEEFRFQDIDPANTRIFPERFALLRFTLAY